MMEPDSAARGSIGHDTSSLPLSEQAKKIVEDLKEQASTVAGSVTETAGQEADEIKAAAKEVLADATDRVGSAVRQQKTAGADYIETVARAIERAAGEFEPDVPQAAKYIRQAGSQLSDLATAVRQRDARELVAEVEGFARRQPALFFGGAMLAGFAAIRFLKSASPKTAQSEVPSG